MSPIPAHNHSALKILVVDDDGLTRLLAKRILESDGFQVVLAEDGEDGFKKFLAHMPDMVLTDYQMPGMTGSQLARKICAWVRARHGDLPVSIPIVVFTGLGEPEVLKECLNAGVVEFLTKPFNTPELLTRIRAIAEMASAHAGLLARQFDEQQEISVVKHVLGRLVEHSRATLPPGFIMETMATRRINGDVCVYHVGAPGIHFGMICDPMGHGLMAGISEIPTMDVFNALTAKNLPLPGIIRGINKKLMDLLPTGRFSCVLLFRMDLYSGELTLINAGFPDALLLRGDGSLSRFSSTCIPLGIQEDLKGLEVQQAELSPGDCFFAFSDGLSDIVNEEELVGLFRQGGEAGFMERLQGLLDERIRNRELADDVSCCLWPFRPEQMALAKAPPEVRLDDMDATGIELNLTFDPRVLNYYNLGPNLVGFLGRNGVPDEVAQILALLLSESIVNAVDHGVLGLDSTLKESGIDAYQSSRAAQLALMNTNHVGVRILVNQTLDGAFSHLQVHVTDPGQGFDWRKALQTPEGPSLKPHGRGLIMLKALGRDLSFNEAGNEIRFRLYATEG